MFRLFFCKNFRKLRSASAVNRADSLKANYPYVPKIKQHLNLYFANRILKATGIETKGLHSLRHTFATNLVNGIKQPDGSIKSLTPRQVADLLGHTTSEITELHYVKRDSTKLNGITDGFEM